MQVETVNLFTFALYNHYLPKVIKENNMRL